MKACTICAKGSLIAGGYSNRVRATKFNPTGKVRRQPNLQWVRLGEAFARRATLPGKQGRVKVCTNCLKKNRHLVG